MTDYTVGDTFYMNFTTRHLTTNAPTVLAGTPGVSAIEDNNATPITTGITLTVDIGSVVGLNNLEIVATIGNGFESGKQYTLYIDTGTIGGASVIGLAVGEFTLGRVANLVWDEVLTGGTHNISASSGKRLRLTQENLGYEGGAVWIDSINGIAGTAQFENGTAGNPVDSITDAQTIATGLTLTRFEFAPESTFTLLANFVNSTLRGDHWSLTGGGFDISGTNITGADVDGVFVAVTGEWNFRDCHVEITNVTIPPDGHFHFCDFNGNLTLGSVGDYAFYSCRSNIAGGGSPNIDFGALGGATVSFREYSGGMEFENMAAGDIVTFEGNGQIIINVNCTGGSIHIRGNVKVTDNANGAVTLDDDARFARSIVTDDIWDEVLTGGTHNVTNSAGRRIRLLQDSGSYENGLVWLDTEDGTAGTTLFENGTNVLPVNTVTDANTILAGLALHGIHAAAGSTVIFTTSQTNQEWAGDGYSINFNGQDITGISISNATISGISSGISTAFRSCFLNSCMLAGGDFIDCAIAGTITLATSGTYHFYRSHHAGPATIDFGALVNGSTTVHIHGYVGGLTILNMGQLGTDLLFFDSTGGQLTLDSTCVGGTVNISGTFNFINNSTGMTINNQGAIVEIIGPPVGTNISTDIANVLTLALTESYAANGVSPTLTEAIFAIHQMLMQFGITGTNYAVRQLDDVSTAFSVTLNSSTSPTDAKRV